MCRQLGFADAIEATKLSEFGTVPADFAYDQVFCSGDEATLDQCIHKDTEDCNVNEGAGVRCQ